MRAATGARARVGVVYVDSRSERALFDTAHLDLLAAFCNQAAIAIDNARLFADLRRHSAKSPR